MGAWSAENATKAYLKTMKLGKSAKEPNGAEFISALAAGNNAQVVVAVCAAAVDDTTLALAAAAQQTGGRLICILPTDQDLHVSTNLLRTNNVTDKVEFVVGDASEVLKNHYSEADFLAIDCNIDSYELVLRTVQGSTRMNSTIVLGYNAFCKGTWRKGGEHTQLLPIGDGLLLTRMPANSAPPPAKRGHWVVKVDKCTGEEHVFRVRSPQGRVAKA